MNKKEILKLIVPLVSKVDDSINDFVYEAISGGGLGICKQYFLYDKSIDMLLPLDYKSLEGKNFNWSKYKQASIENAKNVEVEVSDFPKDRRIKALTGECASALLFSDRINDYFNYQKMLLCPLYDDFIVYMKVGDINDYLAFNAIVMSIARNKDNDRIPITTNIFLFDPTSLSINKLNKEELYGNDFNVVTLNKKSLNIGSDIRKEAEKLLFSRLSRERGNAEAVNLFINPDFSNMKETMLLEIEKEIRDMIKSGKNIKREPGS